MDVVPADAPLLLEARIEPHLIDKVRAGLPADLRFTAFAHSPQLVVAGEVHVGIQRPAEPSSRAAPCSPTTWPASRSRPTA